MASCQWEHIYADDLALLATTMDELLSKLGNCKKHLEAKGLRVNVSKTKIMIRGKNMHSLRDSGKHPCGVCQKVLEVIQFFVVGVSYGSIENAVASKVN